MISTQEKLDQFTEEDLEELIQAHADIPYCYKPSSIRKIYRNWIRSKTVTESFPEIFAAKLELLKKKWNNQKKKFVPYQVGYIELNYKEPSYRVHLIRVPEYKVSWQDEIPNKKIAMETSLRNFCRTNKVRLLNSGTPGIKIIETVFSMR